MDYLELGYQDCLERVVAIGEEIESMLQLQMPFLRKEVNSIIKTNNTDPRTIERTLDTLLAYIAWGKGKKEFERLNAYYATIQPEYAQRYDEFYAEMQE